MEECSPLSTPDQESIDKVVTQISPHQKTMDPSSVGFVYQWMFSMMASALNFRSVSNNGSDVIKSDDEDDCSDNSIESNNSNNDNISNNDNSSNNNSNEENNSSGDDNKSEEKDSSNFINSLGNIRLSATSEFEKTEDESHFYNDSDEESDNIQEGEAQCNSDIINNNNSMVQDNQHQHQHEQRTTDHFFNNILNITSSGPRKTLILDLDETLVHSTMKPVSHHHLTVQVLIENSYCTFYVIKRPHVDYFIQKVSQWYDVVIFTASMQQYADPLLDQLDVNKVFKKRLFRDSCLEKDGNYIKDLSLINQDLTSTIIIDNSPIAYSNNLENAIPIDNWMGDMNCNDISLLNLLPFLEIIRHVQDVRSILSLKLLGPHVNQ